MVDAIAGVYKNAPTRVFENVSEQVILQLQELYKYCEINKKLKRANKFFKTDDQCAIMVVPKNGKLQIKPLFRHSYDVIPMPFDPDIAYAYVLSEYDKDENYNLLNNTSDVADRRSQLGTRNYKDTGSNLPIADQNDYKILRGKYVFWTDKYHFKLNDEGLFWDAEKQSWVDSIEEEKILNPIYKETGIPTLPFIDVSIEKDSEFFVRTGSPLTEFNIDFGVNLCDSVQINRLQGYAQAIVKSVNKPNFEQIGPNVVLHLPLDPNRPELAPDFQFVNPSPNLDASINLLTSLLLMFLSSRGIDPKTVTVNESGGSGYSSALERFLAMLEKFEATQDDFDVFYGVESELFHLIKLWMKTLSGVSVEDGGLYPEFQINIPDDAKVEINFFTPMMVETQEQKENRLYRQYEMGVITQKELIMEIRGVDEAKAQKIIDETALSPIRGLDDRQTIERE
jgi:hypothetical protein